MKPFQKLDGLVAPMDRANVDTDAIIPKQFLKSIKRSGFGLALDEAGARHNQHQLDVVGLAAALRHCGRCAQILDARVGV